MKIRSGFVSNSSSSSFVLITTLENHNKALDQMELHQAEMIDMIVGCKKIEGTELTVVSTYTGDGITSNSSYCWDGLDSSNEAFNPDNDIQLGSDLSSAVYRYREAVKKVGGDYIVKEEDV